MNGAGVSTKKPKGGLEVSSDQITSELVAIRERIAALETIASLSNRAVVEKYVTDAITSSQAKTIMIACEVAKTREELTKPLGYATSQALDHHLKPLRENDLLQQSSNSSGKMTFEWSNLFRRLPKTTIKRILGKGKK